MSDVKDLFCKHEDNYIEGYLGDKKSEILFVLREPHATAEDTKDFWLYKVVNGCRTDGKRYVNVLGRIAAKLLEEHKKKDEEDLDYYKRVLKHCAFINLYPFCGEEYKSKNYVETLRALSDLDSKAVPLTANDKKAFSTIAANRLGIINELNPRYIVTVCDIYEALKTQPSLTEQPWICYNNKLFNSFKFENGPRVLAFYHPSYTRIKYEALDSANISLEADRS